MCENLYNQKNDLKKKTKIGYFSCVLRVKSENGLR